MMDDADRDFAEHRTDLAEDRTLLANERTFAGWMRTSLACIALGIGFHALFGKVEPSWLPRSVVTAFLGLAILVIVFAERRATAVLRRPDAHAIRSARRINLRLFAGIIIIGAAGLIPMIWTLQADA